jgi:hypothetical protein
MFSLAIIYALYGCSWGMTPDKTSVKVSNTMSSIDKENSDKDQTKNALTISISQDFIWDSK